MKKSKPKEELEDDFDERDEEVVDEDKESEDSGSSVGVIKPGKLTLQMQTLVSAVAEADVKNWKAYNYNSDRSWSWRSTDNT